MDGGAEANLLQAVWAAGTFIPDLEDAGAALAPLVAPHRSAELRAVGHVWRAYSLVARGRWNDAMAELDRAAALNAPLALEHRAYLSLLPFLPDGVADRAAIGRALRAYDPVTAPPSPSPSLWLAVHNGVHAQLRTYLLAMVDAYGGLAAEAPPPDALGSYDAPQELGSVLADLSRGAQEAALWNRGEPERAAAVMDQLEFLGWYQYTVASPFFSLSNERFLMGMAYQAVGRPDEALRWFSSFWNGSVFDRAYQAPSHLYRARIHEQLRNLEDARYHYERFLDMWRDADDAFQPLLYEAQARLSDMEHTTER